MCDRRAERKKEGQCFVTCSLQLALQLMGKFFTLCHKIKFRLYQTLISGQFMFILYRRWTGQLLQIPKPSRIQRVPPRAAGVVFQFILNNLTSQSSYHGQELNHQESNKLRCSKRSFPV